MESKFRIHELDSLRGLAAISVVLYHFTTQYFNIFNDETTVNFLNFKYGHYGVQLFFIISGFVIFMTTSRISSAKDFIFKRFIRLYPVFWVCVTITYIITNLYPIGLEVSNKDFFLNFTMIPSLLGFKNVDGAYWSLIPELFFYLLILFLIIFNITKRIITIGFIWLLGSALFYLGYVNNFISNLLNLKYAILFMAGINFYLIKNNIKSKNVINHIQIILCVTISFLNSNWEFSAFFIFFILVFYAFCYDLLKFLNNKILIYLGSISYSLYLIHQFVGYSVQHYLINILYLNNKYLIIVIPLLISLILASLVNRFIEEPVLKWANVKYSSFRKVKNEN